MEIEEILAKLDPKTRARVQAATAVQVEKQRTPSVGLNQALKGGIGYGRQTLLWGAKSAGKTSMLLQIIAQAQRDGKTAALVDAEHSFDASWAKRLGVNIKQLIHSPVKTTNDMVEVGVELLKYKVDVFGVDSISTLLPSSYFEKDGNELKNLDNTKQIGSEARDLANAVKMLNYANEKTAVILISQVRNKITTYGAMQQATGGHAVDFFSSTVIKLWSSYREADQITGDVFVGDKIFKRPVGRKVNWTIEKNKLGPPNQMGEYDFYYDGDFVGVDTLGETVDVAEKLGLISKGGAWYSLFEQKLQGRIKVIEWLRENPEYGEKLREMVNEFGQEQV